MRDERSAAGAGWRVDRVRPGVLALTFAVLVTACGDSNPVNDLADVRERDRDDGSSDRREDLVDTMAIDPGQDVGPDAGTDLGDDVAPSDGTGDGTGDGGASVVGLTVLRAGVPGNAEWAAYQEGSGAWQPLAPTGPGSYSFVLAGGGGPYGIAIACQDSGLVRAEVVVLQATYEELPAASLRCEPPTVPPRHQLSGAITGVAAEAVVAFSFDDSAPVEVGPPSYALARLEGRHDLAASRGFGSFNLGFSADRVILRRDIDFVADRTEDLDFSSDGFVPEDSGFTASVGPFDNEAQRFQFFYRTANDSRVALGKFITGATRPVLVVPAALRRPGELYEFFGAGTSTTGTLVVSRSAQRFLAEPATLALLLPEPYETPTAALGSTDPYPIVTATLGSPPASDLVEIRASTESGAIVRRWTSHLTTGWRAEQDSYTFADFSAVAGWSNDWALLGLGTAIDWSISSVLHSRGASGILGDPIDADDLRRSTRSDTLSP